jgi:hypothetical protein
MSDVRKQAYKSSIKNQYFHAFCFLEFSFTWLLYMNKWTNFRSLCLKRENVLYFMKSSKKACQG